MKPFIFKLPALGFFLAIIFAFMPRTSAAAAELKSEFKITAPKTWQRVPSTFPGSLYQNPRSPKREVILVFSRDFKNAPQASREAVIQAASKIGQARAHYLNTFGLRNYVLQSIQATRFKHSGSTPALVLESSHLGTDSAETQMIERQYLLADKIYYVVYSEVSNGISDHERVSALMDQFVPVLSNSRAPASETKTGDDHGLSLRLNKSDDAAPATSRPSLIPSDCSEVPVEKRISAKDSSLVSVGGVLSWDLGCVKGLINSIPQVAEDLGKVGTLIKNVVTAPWYYATDDKFYAQTNAAAAVAIEAVRNPKKLAERAWNGITTAIASSVQNFGCLNSTAKGEVVCRYIAESVETGLLMGVAFRGGVMAAQLVERSAVHAKRAMQAVLGGGGSKTKIVEAVAKVKPPVVEAPKSTAPAREARLVEDREALSPSRASVEELRERAFQKPVEPSSVGEYNVSDVLQNRAKLNSELGAKPYSSAAKEVETLAGRESVTGVKLKKKMGEGFNADVHLGADGSIYKFPKGAKGASSLENEAAVAKDLKKFKDVYGIRVLENETVDPKFRFLKKPLVPKEQLATEILKKGPLSAEQTSALERLFYQSRVYAQKTGIGLDLKAENLFWDAKRAEWTLLEAGPRTSYLPYGYTLDVENFGKYSKIWNSVEPPADIESLAGKALMKEYATLNREAQGVAEWTQKLPPSEAAHKIAEMVEQKTISPAAKYRALKDLTPEMNARVLAERVNLQNKVDVEGPLRAGIEKSKLKGPELEIALHDATRFANTQDYTNFLKGLSKANGGRKLAMLPDSNVSFPLNYLGTKANVGLAGVTSSFADLAATSSNLRLTLLLTTKDAESVAKSATTLADLKKIKDLDIVISDQLDKGITPFNYKNPDAISNALTHSSASRVEDAKQALEKLGIGSRVRAVYYDGALSPSERIAFDAKPKGSLSVEAAATKIAPPRLTPDQIQQQFRNSSLPTNRHAELLQFSAADLRLESLQKTNERVGTLLKQARATAAASGADDGVYFWVQDRYKSPSLIKKILSDSYGVPANRFLISGDPTRIPTTAKKAMVLVIDDFMGSGHSMDNFLKMAGKKAQLIGADGEAVPKTVHAFVPFSTEEGRAFILKKSPTEPFIAETLPNVKREVGYKAMNSRTGFELERGYNDSNTAIGFEYMSPDNNVGELGELLPVWTLPTAIKSP